MTTTLPQPADLFDVIAEASHSDKRYVCEFTWMKPLTGDQWAEVEDAFRIAVLFDGAATRYQTDEKLVVTIILPPRKWGA